MRIIFAGTPEFAVPALQSLIDEPHEICAVYTQPDRPSGRGRRVHPSPVKVVALDAGVPVCQPSTLRDLEVQQRLDGWAADLMVVVAYGLLLPLAVLRAPRLGCINVHASLLPRWRGAAPIQRAILAGDVTTGVTLMQMDEGLDTGDMLAKAAAPIGPRDSAGVLHDRLAQLGARLLVDTLPALAAGTAYRTAQDDALATYAAKISKEEARIDWGRPAVELDRLVRAFDPWPVAHTALDDKPLRIWVARALTRTVDAVPGTVVAAGTQGIDVATGEGCLRLLEVQPAGSRRMGVGDFLNAHAVTGRVLGASAVS